MTIVKTKETYNHKQEGSSSIESFVIEACSPDSYHRRYEEGENRHTFRQEKMFESYAKMIDILHKKNMLSLDDINEIFDFEKKITEIVRN